MLNTIFAILEVFVKYSFLYLYLYYVGRSSIHLINKVFVGETLPSRILFIKTQYFYPIVGICLVGNLLVIINFIFPLKSPFVSILLLLLIIPNFFNINLDNLNFINVQNFICFVVIPGLLLLSSFDTGFHYDAGYYHLNHQNWLRESNLILGMVNIFWPFGMSSIFEYISSIVWFDNSFIYLHFITIIFIHFFYNFILDNLINRKNLILANASFFLLVFSILDNFGIQGGRNGFIFIQGVGKQDIEVGVLFLFISLVSLVYIYGEKANLLDLVCLSLLTLFTFQIKVSGVFVLAIYVMLLIFILNRKQQTFKNILIIHTPVLILSFFWFVKSYLTTGCLIFPLSVTCINSFDWYVLGSTEIFENITKISSLAFHEYFHDPLLTYQDWIIDFLNYEFYRSVFINFTSSLLFILLLKFILFKSVRPNWLFISISIIFIVFNFVYLLFYGPIPRYSIGIMLTTVACLAFFTGELKVQISKTVLYILIICSAALLVRFSTYMGIISNPEYEIFDPREVAVYVRTAENWVIPDNGDQCWINLECSMAQVYNPKTDVFLDETGLFKTARR
ncbi:hypothetical protein OAH60_00700 [Acidimicrobiia bacterium]|nr:hypothetical protein [Acidimicrobiia bacterium]